MTLGLTKDELQALFEREFLHAQSIRQPIRPEIEIDLVKQGIPATEAKLYSLFQIQLEAHSQALLLTVLENNKRLEKQLK